MEAEEFLTAAELAGRLRVRIGTVYSWAADGRLPSVRMGRLVRFSPTAIEKWLSGRAVRGQAIPTVTEPGAQGRRAMCGEP
ncbi:helix-turn-helix domain-containing protein [bacterium]|nr:helix-turn-helix domain-containing protein [bacterium]